MGRAGCRPMGRRKTAASGRARCRDLPAAGSSARRDYARGMPEPRPGIDVPDHRGRTGLDQAGRDLQRNPDVRVTDVEVLASAWHVLRRTTLEYRDPAGRWETQQRETYDRG